MTIETQQGRASYSGDGVSTVFAVPFKFFHASHIKAIKQSALGVDSTLTRGVDYDLTGAGDASGGELTTETALATGETLSVILDAPLLQDTRYVEDDPFPAAAHEAALDQGVQHNIRTRDLVSRALRFPDGDASANGLLPGKAARAGKFLYFAVSTGIAEAAGTLPLDQVLSRSTIGSFLNPQTEAESAESITPDRPFYLDDDIRRYNAAADYDWDVEEPGQVAQLATDNWAAVDKACRVAQARGGGIVRIMGGGTYWMSDGIRCREYQNVYLYIEPGTTLLTTTPNSIGATFSFNVGLDINGDPDWTKPSRNVGAFGGGTIRNTRMDHATLSAHPGNAQSVAAGTWIKNTDTNGRMRAYWTRLGGTTGTGTPPTSVNVPSIDGTVTWLDGDNTNALGCAGVGIFIDHLQIPESSGKMITSQTPTTKGLRITRVYGGYTNDKGIEIKGTQGLDSQDAYFLEDAYVAGNYVEWTGHHGMEFEQINGADHPNKNMRMLYNTVGSAGNVTGGSAFRVHRAYEIEFRGNRSYGATHHSNHFLNCDHITGDVQGENALLTGCTFFECNNFSMDTIRIKNPGTHGVEEEACTGGGRVGRLFVEDLDTNRHGWKETSRAGARPFIETYSIGWTGSRGTGVHFDGTYPEVRFQKASFVLRLRMNSTTLQHQIINDSVNQSAAPSTYGITGASATLTNTPTGTNSSTAFATGGKLSSAATNEFILDCLENVNSALFEGATCQIEINDSGTAGLTARLLRRDQDVNGTTRSRYIVGIQNAGSGFDLTSLADTKVIAVRLNLPML